MSTADAIPFPPFPRPFPQEILVLIARSLARDGLSRTLGALLSTSKSLYDLLLPTLYRTIFVSDRSSVLFRDIIEDSLRREPRSSLGRYDAINLGITFGFDTNSLLSPYPPTFHTNTRDRAKLVRTLSIGQSAADAVYRRCALEWFIPPYPVQAWLPLLPSLERIILPASVIQSIAHRFQGLPSVIDATNVDSVTKWLAWYTPFKVLCEGIRLLSPLSAKLCIHLTYDEYEDEARGEIRRDGQVQETLIALEILRSLQGSKTVVYRPPDIPTPVNRAALGHDLLAIIKYAISGARGTIKLVLRSPETEMRSPTVDTDVEAGGQTNLDVDLPPPGLPNAEAEHLWMLARERSAASTVGVPPQNQWPRDRVDWRRFYDFLRRDMVLVNANHGHREVSCPSCGGDW